MGEEQNVETYIRNYFIIFIKLNTCNGFKQYIMFGPHLSTIG